VTEIVVDTIAGRKPVLCGVSHPSSTEAVALATMPEMPALMP